MTITINDISDESVNFSNCQSSLGLDFWYSRQGTDWVNSFLNSTRLDFEITDGSNKVSIHCLLRSLPGGYYLASVYPYTEVQGNIDLLWKNKKSLIKELKKRKIVRLEMPFSGEHEGLFSSDFQDASLHAVRHVIDLSEANGDLAWLDKHFGRKIRWAVRKSQRDGCSIRLATVAEIDVVQDLYVKTMQAKGAPINYPAMRFEGIITKLAPEGLGKIYIGCIDDKPAGFAAIVDAKISRHFIQLAVPPEAQHHRLSELLVATVIQDALTEGKTYFDFMASQKDDTGLISFKAKWGAKEEAINYAVIVGNPILSWIISILRWGNKLRGKLSASKAHS